MKRLAIFAFLISSLAFAQAPRNDKQAEPPKQTIALRCGSMIDVVSGTLRRNVTIVVTGDRIQSVGSAAPTGVQTIDLSSSVCLPGLVESHTHILLQGDITAADYDEQILKESVALTTASRRFAILKPKAPDTRMWI